MKRYYILLLILFAGFNVNAQVVYPSPICINSTSIVSPVFSPDIPMGGTFSSQVGIMINSVTGQIDLASSAPGTYVIIYDVPASPPDNPAMSYSCVVVLTAPFTPNFAPPSSPICSGSTLPTMPTVSNDGVSGTWTVTETDLDFLTILTYTFSPADGQCASNVTMTVEVVSTYVPVITSASGLNTVYVDANNEVVVPLALLSDMPLGYSYQWYVDTDLIPEATGANHIVNTAASTENARSYRIYVTRNDAGCHTFSSQFMVYQSNGTPPPLADRFQTFPSGATLADIVISGAGIHWYSSAQNRNNLLTELPLTTVLVDGMTYYASQTVNGSESVERLPVTVQLALETDDNDLISVNYFPNPVTNSLMIQASKTIDSISVFNILGQVLKTSNHNQTEVIENMGEFSAGTYFIRVSSGSIREVIKVVKQ